MTAPYIKKAISFSEQIDLLSSRGMLFENISDPEHYLSNYGYYRLSAYWYFFREVKSESSYRKDTFLKGTQFQEIIQLYEFDTELRLLTLKAIEKIEISLRTAITYSLSHHQDPFAQYNKANFHPGFNHAAWQKEVTEEVLRSKDQFIRHFKTTYTGFPKIPTWMHTEVLSLGKLSRLYSGLEHTIKREIAHNFQIHYKALAGWLHTLSVLRNICAHHGRLWNREMPIKKGYIKHKFWLPPYTPSHGRFFYSLLVLKELLGSRNLLDDWFDECIKLLLLFLEKAEYRKAMGFPENWKQHPLIEYRKERTE